MTDSSKTTGLRGKHPWVRWVAGVTLGLLHSLNAATVYLIVSAGPAGEWDDAGYAGTAAGALFAIVLSVIGVLITLIPPVRRSLGLWWLAPPVILGVIAWVRIATLE
ncbi:hypothetical protein ACFCV9_11025 [Streptomyces sp. NPDC056367]|uniref:hypothetical protein n=1 Tax=unclassified Streptomyces TaxID=2593676 RepID=UPI0035DFEE85